MPTLATSLLQGLKDHGAREIFGIPGDFVLPFFKVIEESGILPHYTLSHEPGQGRTASFAAAQLAHVLVGLIACEAESTQQVAHALLRGLRVRLRPDSLDDRLVLAQGLKC